MSDLSGKKIAFLLTNGVEEVELTRPRKALDDAGAQTVIVSPAEGTLTAMNGDWDHGDSFDVDLPLSEAKPEEFDALVLPGGTINADTLRIAEGATDFVRAFFDQEKTVAAICHAPWLIVEADLVVGKTLTSFPSLRTDVNNAGGAWVDKPVVVDETNGFALITSRTPEDMKQFTAAISGQLN